jgi:hypothetical protein
MVRPNTSIGPCPTSMASHSTPITSSFSSSRSTGGLAGSIVPSGACARRRSGFMACVPMAPTPEGLGTQAPSGAYP